MLFIVPMFYRYSMCWECLWSLVLSHRCSGKPWRCQWLNVGPHGVSNRLLCGGDHVCLGLHKSYQVDASFCSYRLLTWVTRTSLSKPDNNGICSYCLSDTEYISNQKWKSCASPSLLRPLLSVWRPVSGRLRTVLRATVPPRSPRVTSHQNTTPPNSMSISTTWATSSQKRIQVEVLVLHFRRLMVYYYRNFALNTFFCLLDCNTNAR